MFGGTKIKIEKGLYERVKKVAEIAGYSSVDEFITHIIERELAKIENAEGDDQVKERLKGLGYIS